MKILVTGSAGHLGEGIIRTLRSAGHEVLGLDILRSDYTDLHGTIAERAFVKTCMKDINLVLHTATLHKPHVDTHRKQDFIDTNITGTLNLLEESVIAGVSAFIFTSTTSTFGDALVPPAGQPSAWITEDVVPVPKNIYGVTKVAAEDLCALFYRNHRLPCLVLRTSRFFPEEDDNKDVSEQYDAGNAKVNELLYRRIDLQDAVSAHLAAMEKAQEIGFGKFIISATTPFTPEDLQALRLHAPDVLRRHIPAYEAEYARRGWKMFPEIDRVYVNDRARNDLGWHPQYNFADALSRLQAGEDFRSPLAQLVGSKGYHARSFNESKTQA